MTTAGKRQQTLLEWAGAIQLSPALPACRILHIAPVAAELAAGEVAEQVPAEFVGLTPQGLIRSWDATGRVLLRPIEGGSELARRVHAVVAAECEYPYLAPLLEGAVHAGAVAVVTKGAAGCEVRSTAGIEQYPAVRVAEPVDDTGAGDVFAAALFVELHRGTAVAEAVRFASAAAALSLRGIGPHGIASRTEIAGLAASAS
ncbi:MAG TPA: PfkB family carbohydrate kinase [Micromonosporaceae bacterium]|nr:PfkB family carbohydrate kinase [Micromonosporaceae bacterium]